MKHSNSSYSPSTKSSDERGFASLVVGMILVVVLALLVVGFGQLSLHEQRQALSSQLSTQAYYAAETGVDDAIHDLTTYDSTIHDTYLHGGSTPNISNTTCMDPAAAPAGAYTASNTIGSLTNDVSYSCLLVSLTTNSLVYSNVQPDDARTVVFSAANLQNLTLTWGDTTNSTNFASPFPNLTTTGAWHYPGVIQFSITPITGAVDRGSLTNAAFAVYAYPSSNNGNVATYSTAYTSGSDQGRIVPGNCGTAGPALCSITLNSIPTPASAYVVHFVDFYDPSNVTLTGTDGSGSPVSFTGGQAVIDVTGKAKYVLKRLQVRIPLNSPAFPNYAIQAQDICKRMESMPGETQFVATDGGPAKTTAPVDDPFCKLSP